MKKSSKRSTPLPRDAGVNLAAEERQGEGVDQAVEGQQVEEVSLLLYAGWGR